VNLLADEVRSVMRAHWQTEGYTVPNAGTYPFQWLWDSCFHALIWAELGEADRAVAELAHLFRNQDSSGFVPHIDYRADEHFHAGFWGRSGASTITQPPMYGHALAELTRAGVAVPAGLVDQAIAGLAWFLRERRHRSGLVRIVHPWETGCDDSPRFDHWGCADLARWFEVKGALVRDLPADGFDCAPVSITALVAWNARELASVTGDVGLLAGAAELADAVAARWDPALATWVDAGAAAATSGRARSLEGLLGLLVDPRDEAVAALVDPAGHGGPFGPAGVHRAEPCFEPRRYWRGPVWPQLAYLLVVAGATELAGPTVAGARRSGLAEYWDPDTGEGLGAVPQSWTGLALLLDRSAQAGDGCGQEHL
jgi:hypothetical protein